MYDMKNMTHLKDFGQHAPDVWKSFIDFDKAAFADGAIPVKMKELIAVAVAMATQCPYCIEIHTKRARAAGATDAELAEAIMVCAAIRAGGAVTHGTHAISG